MTSRNFSATVRNASVSWATFHGELLALKEILGALGFIDSLGDWFARDPGLTVQAAYYEYGKLFVHAGVLPNIVELATRERGAGDAKTVVSYVNDVLRRTLVERERISARDLPHEIFHIGTSHTREPRMPGEIGYEPAGVFTPDLRELDHYRFHAHLLPQVVGHTASRRGEIRYSPGSWLSRDYIAIDVGRQHGTGNGGLLLTDFGWVAVTPGGPARLVEVTPLFVELARTTAGEAWADEHGEARVRQALRNYFQVAPPEPGTLGEVQQALFADLSPAQIVSLERFLARIRQTGQCVVVTDLHQMLTAFSGGAVAADTIEVLAAYVAAGGVLIFSTDTTFDWLYAELLRPLIVELGPRSHLLTRALLVLSHGTEIFVFQDGAYRLISSDATRNSSRSFEALVELAKEGRVEGIPALDPSTVVYIADSAAPGSIDDAMASQVAVVIDVGHDTVGDTAKPILSFKRGYHRTIDVIVAATAAMHESGAGGA